MVFIKYTMMKKFRKLIGLSIAAALCQPLAGKAQGQELQQLLLNIEKLTQMKSILSDMKTGYQIYQQGYGAISSISKGNFSLHSTYLNGLLAISPAVKNYGRVAEILTMQSSLLREYKTSLSRFRQSGVFSVTELDYIAKVYSRLGAGCLDNIAELTNILTASKLRMTDAERIQAIDRIYLSSTDKLQFLRSFNRQGVTLSIQRTKDATSVRNLKELYGLTH